MPLQIVYGESRQRHLALQLAGEIAKTVSDGTIYLGYPVLASTGDSVEIGALFVSEEHGLVAFLLAESLPTSPEEWEQYISEQDRLYALLESNLGRHDELRHGRRLAVEINTATVFPARVAAAPKGSDGHYCGIDEVADWVNSLGPLDKQVLRALRAAMQRVSTIKPDKKRSSVRDDASRGATLRTIERGIANLDQWQNQAAIESPEGPQRIRGLAGSGKTVVLALKASYLHAQHPDWRIAFTFHTRSLYQQIEDLIIRFSFEHSNDRPDPDYLQVMHSWGSTNRPGIYSAIATAIGATPRDYNYARATYGVQNAFQGVCAELLAIAKQSNHGPIFDAVLVDEAQDLPPEFFQLLYRFTADPKRIVWAYDELQKLSESAMPDTNEMFGVGPKGQSLVSIENKEGEPKRDIVLPVCYRNTPWALATAHALGIGVYRREGLVQHFDEPELWRDIGYNVLHGELTLGAHVTLERSASSYPEYFEHLIGRDDAVVLKAFEDELSQDNWIASQIAINLNTDELEHDDILIVLPDAYTAKSRGTRLMQTLYRNGIESHLVGVSTSVDEVFKKGSIAIAHVFRAKGNEAPMVYVVDAQQAASLSNVLTRRNTLFTSITRSRAWVRITGWGERMIPIAQEVSAVKSADFRLDFTIPSASKLAALRRINRDRTGADEASARRARENLENFINAYERREIDIDEIPPHVRTRLINALRKDMPDGDEF